ncbi:hypothetical protein [Erwinia pyrifoliae]|uniref:hypothetical protein n=1 Tax=Erwinia pyrifoliae TaxID=79967 RepID=UPI0001B7132F|nr:hypothetical protein [Erwinia pyrifoliae]CAX53396.1 conserved uncharacterized protein [Erwinia pyrifoliae Ep1/96]CAY76368.1 hypothetical protein EPYR_04034 [Erwinia pyrifoliae DSM 12163]
MKKGLLLSVLLALSVGCHAAGKAEAVYTGPDCSKDADGPIFSGLWATFSSDKIKYKKYYDFMLSDGSDSLKITRLSSEKISKKEAERLMYRRAKRDGIKEAEIKNRGIVDQYLGEDLYRQYYLVESKDNFKLIAEFYSASLPGKYPAGSRKGQSCGNDLERIYVISDAIDGHTFDFSTH